MPLRDACQRRCQRRVIECVKEKRSYNLYRSRKGLVFSGYRLDRRPANSIRMICGFELTREIRKEYN